MLIKIYPENPNMKNVMQVVDILRAGGVVVYPTDGVYAFGCSIKSVKGVERIKNIRGKKESGFSIMCSDLGNIADYARVDNAEFRTLKRNLPGPFTFILNASSRVPDKILGKRKTIGIRVADNQIPLTIIKELGEPLVTSSVKADDDVIEYITDPELIEEKWGGIVDAVIDGGYGDIVPTTLVDLTGDDVEILREGGGELKL